MASSSADCVLAGARLTSSATTTLAKIGPGRKVNVAVCGWKTLVPRMSDGMRSGVNWMRWKRSDAAVERVARRRRGEAAGHERLGRARHALDQDVAADQQRGEQQAERLVEVDQHAARAGQRGVPETRRASSRVLERADRGDQVRFRAGRVDARQTVGQRRRPSGRQRSRGRSSRR